MSGKWVVEHGSSPSPGSPEPEWSRTIQDVCAVFVEGQEIYVQALRAELLPKPDTVVENKEKQ